MTALLQKLYNNPVLVAALVAAGLLAGAYGI